MTVDNCLGSANTSPWAAAQGISTHWLRHTTLTWVERHFGYASPAPSPTTPTRRRRDHHLIKADLQAVATALAAMTGQPHPLANATSPDSLYGGALA